MSNKLILNTDGSGLWSNEARHVHITKICVDAFVTSRSFRDVLFGELRVFFSTDTWNIREHGLIYTDDRFLKELCSYLESESLVGFDVDYSEQGMQGNDYVSLDVGDMFIRSWAERFGISLPSGADEEELHDALNSINGVVLKPSLS